MRSSRHILTALAMIFMVSCIKMDRIGDSSAEEISFSPIGQVQSRSALTKATGYPEDGVFGLYAYYADCQGGTNWDADPAWPAATPYLKNVAYAWNGTSWGGYDLESLNSTSYYWPFSGSLMFAGYSPHKDVSGGTIESVSLNPNINARGDINPYIHIKFTQNVKPSEMVDLMWFDVKDVAAGKSLSKTAEAVDVLFKHALSKVSLSFEDSQSRYKLSSVVMRNCINSSEFYSGKTAGWMPDINALADYHIPVTDSGDLSPLYIIPQYLDGIFPTLGSGTIDSGVDVILEFTITDGFGSQTVQILMKEYTERWEFGKHYSYTIAVDADPIDFGSPKITITSQTIAM